METFPNNQIIGDNGTSNFVKDSRPLIQTFQEEQNYVYKNYMVFKELKIEVYSM